MAQAWIARACGDDDSLRREVQSLVEASVAASSLFETPPFPVESVLGLIEAAGQRSAIGRRIGAYRVIGEIGRGGMGAVYLAERADDAFQKRVAIKLIKRGTDTDAILRRFRHERQILAGLSHPNIALLLDGGTTDDGLPYFVMEYVEACRIDVYCDAHRLRSRAPGAVPSTCAPPCSTRTRTWSSTATSSPRNILVTATGVPKLLDFGIAKLLDARRRHATQHTDGDRAAMTPEYASPEQVRGEPITHRQRRLFAGRRAVRAARRSRPYALDGRTMVEVERLVCHAAPPPRAACSTSTPASRVASRSNWYAARWRATGRRRTDGAEQGPAGPLCDRDRALG